MYLKYDKKVLDHPHQMGVSPFRFSLTQLFHKTLAQLAGNILSTINNNHQEEIFRNLRHYDIKGLNLN